MESVWYVTRDRCSTGLIEADNRFISLSKAGSNKYKYVLTLVYYCLESYDGQVYVYVPACHSHTSVRKGASWAPCFSCCTLPTSQSLRWSITWESTATPMMDSCTSSAKQMVRTPLY